MTCEMTCTGLRYVTYWYYHLNPGRLKASQQIKCNIPDYTKEFKAIVHTAGNNDLVKLDLYVTACNSKKNEKAFNRNPLFLCCFTVSLT